LEAAREEGGEQNKGFRRKEGMVTLVLACLFVSVCVSVCVSVSMCLCLMCLNIYIYVCVCVYVYVCVLCVCARESFRMLKMCAQGYACTIRDKWSVPHSLT